ncbi:hypothetical protein M9Y10_007487 [Tritrichomonas musculus]|uniref:AMP-dependent synthetase/ligase domain-containing protein n=1 Tax=Tritrichomonas musculus TaxID=1915356 RepID=A0ABR2J3A7_9EUKA
MGGDHSSVVLSEPAKPGESKIICPPNYYKIPQTLKNGLYQDFPEGITMYHLFEETYRKYPNLDLYGKRVYSNGQWQERYEYVTRKQFRELRDSVGSFLIQNGFGNNDHIGILSYNRIEWVATQQACFAYGCIPVPIYDTFGPENVAYIINHANIEIIFAVSTKLKDLLQIKPDIVKIIVVFDNEEYPYDESDYSFLLDRVNCKIVKWDEIIKITERYPHKPPTSDTPAAIMYTSGTTGYPKGCIVTHGNFIGSASSLINIYPFTEKDLFLSFLPLAHVFEQVIHFIAIHTQIKIAFYSGSITRLIEEVKIVKPTIFASVARVFERIYDGMQKKLDKLPFLTKLAFNSSYSIKSYLTRKFGIQHVPIIDSVFNKINETAVGGCMKIFVCGGSAISVEIQHFLRIALNISFMQGYGLTETASGVSCQFHNDTMDGNVGVLLNCVQAKLKDLPDMGYYGENFEGELYVKGKTVFQGYYKDEEKTKEVLDEEGWFKTGDIFKLTNTGQLQIIGRAKELVKLSQGEYVSLAKLTKSYVDVKYVNQIYVHADLHSRFLVAVVVLDKNQIGYEKVTPDQMLKLLEDKAIEMQFNGYERIGNVFLTTEEFSPQNGLLTPSLKLAMYKIAKRYDFEIKRMLPLNRLAQISDRHQRSDSCGC